MSNYNPIYHSIWDSKRFINLDNTTKLIFLYLLSNQRVTQTGIYKIRFEQVACDIGLKVEDVENAFDELEGNALIHYWYDEHILFIVNNFRFARNTIKNATILHKVIESQRQLFNLPELWGNFDTLYSAELEVINKVLIKHQSNNTNDINGNANIYRTHNNRKEDN